MDGVGACRAVIVMRRHSIGVVVTYAGVGEREGNIVALQVDSIPQAVSNGTVNQGQAAGVGSEQG